MMVTVLLSFANVIERTARPKKISGGTSSKNSRVWKLFAVLWIPFEQTLVRCVV